MNSFTEFASALASDAKLKIGVSLVSGLVLTVAGAALIASGVEESIILPAVLIVLVPVQYLTYLLFGSVLSTDSCKADNPPTDTDSSVRKNVTPETESASSGGLPTPVLNAVTSWLDTAVHYEPVVTAQTKAALFRSERTRQILGEAARVISREGSDFLLLSGERGTGKSALVRALHAGRHTQSGVVLWISAEQIPSIALNSKLAAFLADYLGRQQHSVGKIVTIVFDELSARRASFFLPALLEARGRFVVDVIVTIHVPVEEPKLASKLINRSRTELVDRRLVELSIPPLRQRRDEIPNLAIAFSRECLPSLSIESLVDSEAVTALTEYEWPGNIRQLKSVVRWWCRHSPRETLSLSALPSGILEKQGIATPELEEWAEAATIVAFERALHHLSRQQSNTVVPAERYATDYSAQVSELAVLLSEEELVTSITRLGRKNVRGLSRVEFMKTASLHIGKLLGLPDFGTWLKGRYFARPGMSRRPT